MAFTVDLTNKGLFSGLYESIWLYNEALDAEVEGIIQSGDATENDTLDWTVDAKTYLKKIAETYCNVLSSVFPNSQWAIPKKSLKWSFITLVAAVALDLIALPVSHGGQNFLLNIIKGN